MRILCIIQIVLLNPYTHASLRIGLNHLYTLIAVNCIARLNGYIYTNTYVHYILEWALNAVRTCLRDNLPLPWCNARSIFITMSSWLCIICNIWKRREKPLTIAVGFRTTVIKFVNKLQTQLRHETYFII